MRLTNVAAELKRFYAEKGYVWHTEPWRLNLCFLRGPLLGKWDDLAVLVRTTDTGEVQTLFVAVTADASATEWVHPKHPDGCVYVMNGQYVDGFVPGFHNGRRAFRQNADFLNVRWPGGSVPTVAALVALGATRSFWAKRGTHWHNRFNNVTPATPLKGDSEGCMVSLHYDQHEAAMVWGDEQVSETGIETISPVFTRWGDVLPG